ncbi:hypothetical protein ABBQ38_014533 [Trebouxia sp. C0009 RCD-2024]
MLRSCFWEAAEPSALSVHLSQALNQEICEHNQVSKRKGQSVRYHTHCRESSSDRIHWQTYPCSGPKGASARKHGRLEPEAIDYTALVADVNITGCALQQALYQASLGLCRSGQTYIESSLNGLRLTSWRG